MVSEIIWNEYLLIGLQSYTTGKASDIPGLGDNAACLEEMKEWIIDHSTIIEEEEEKPRAFQVKVKFEDVRLGHETMTFDVTPTEECSSLKARVATKIGLFAPMIDLSFPRVKLTGYSHNK